MLKFFRRGKLDKTKREEASKSNANDKKQNSSKKEKQNVMVNPKLSMTLGNSFLLSEGKSTSTSTKTEMQCASALSTPNDKNKVVIRNSRAEDQKDSDKLEHSGHHRRKFNYLKYCGQSLAVLDTKDNDSRRKEYAEICHTKEKSSRNEIVDPLGSDRIETTKTPCCDANDRLKWTVFDKNANTSDLHIKDIRQSHLTSQTENQCKEKKLQQVQPRQQQQRRTPPIRCEQKPNASTSFNPINKSRELFYEIMGKNRSRNRNRNRNKDTKPYHRVLIIDKTSVANSIETDQQNIPVLSDQDESNDKTLLQPLECDLENMPNQLQGKIYKADDEKIDFNPVSNPKYPCNEYIGELPKEIQNENEENSEKVGYQITKSKNRTNLVMKAEDEARKDDRAINAEKNLPNGTFGEEEHNDDRDASMRVRESIVGEKSSSDCADASFSDANGIEFENSISDGNKRSTKCDNIKSEIAAEFTNGNPQIDECQTTLDINLPHIYRPTRRVDDKSDTLQSLENPKALDIVYSKTSGSGEDGRQSPDEHYNLLTAFTPLCEEGTITEAQCESLKNSTKTCNRPDIQLQIDQKDLIEEETDSRNISTQFFTRLSGCNGEIGIKSNQEKFNEINMGQDNSKVTSDRHKRSRSDHMQSNLVIPTITVADYSDVSVKEKRKDTKPVSSKIDDDSNSYVIADNEVFYDIETFDVESSENNQKNNPSVGSCSKDITETVNAGDEISDDGVLNSFAEIPVTVIEAGVPIQADPSFPFNVLHSDTLDSSFINISSSSSISQDSKITESPDSGIEILEDSRITVVSDSGEPYSNTIFESENFARGGSTDCDENFLLQSDNEDFFYNAQNPHNHFDNSDYTNKKEKSILIDSISLPDVVVESEAGVAGMGNTNSVKVFDQVADRTSSRNIDSTSSITTDHNDNETQDLIIQEARYSAQLDEAKKVIISTQAKVNDLQAKIDSLEKELSNKSWNVDRLQGELQAANKEDACVRRRLNLLQEELVDIKQKYSENEYELNQKYDELKTKHHELMDNYRHTQNLANALQTQLTFLQNDIERSRQEKQRLCEEKDAELKSLQDMLKQSAENQKALENKWQKEFETLRTQNADREEHLMADCEWKLRTMQKSCKDKLDAAKKEKNDVLQKSEEISTRAAEELERVQHLLPLEAEIKQLRGLTNEQRESLISMTEQMSELRNDLEAANLQLEKEIENVRKIRLHCENALSDKDRQMIQKIEEARGIVAVEWEQRLLEEMTRLKNEVEMVHAEERREALDKLQQEHVEEIKILTCRYDANEEELRLEISKLRETLQEKCDQFNDLKERTDAALLETRLHLERADSEYQRAMNREIEKRDQLAEQLKSEFEHEKLEMEEKFCERLNQVKDEFARELANTTEDLTKKHRKQLGKQPIAYGKKHLSKLGSTCLLSSEQQWDRLIAEKEESLQAMETRYRIRLEEAENRIKELEIQHQREMKEIRTNFEIERTTLETRDLQNSQEIEQLHRKCRCLTNLFEEMRMRYERREPRPEDLREIAELRGRCESQERDLHALTERLREIQMEGAENENSNSGQRKMNVPAKSSHRKAPTKIIPTNCDVIYEENEERESPLKENSKIIDVILSENEEEDEDEDEEDEDEDEEEEHNESEEGSLKVTSVGKEIHQDVFVVEKS